MALNESYKRWHTPKRNNFNENGNLKKGETHQGYYKKEFLKYPEKYIGNLDLIIYRSGWEKSFIRWCDFSPSIVKWSSEPISIPYYDRISKLEECKKYGLNPNDPKNWVIKNYHTDYWIEIDKGNGEIQKMFIEIKPSNKLKRPIPPDKNASLKEHRKFNIQAREYLINEAKFESMRAYAEKNNTKFYVFTEQTLGSLLGRFWTPNNE
jgi:hypothetical protein